MLSSLFAAKTTAKDVFSGDKGEEGIVNFFLTEHIAAHEANH